MADCYVDIWQCDATVVIRQLAAAVSLLGTVTGLVSGRLLIINRGKTNRTQLAARSAKHPRLLLYPEGQSNLTPTQNLTLTLTEGTRT